jgi:POT family proton-dependent oligopeptide transporter
MAFGLIQYSIGRRGLPAEAGVVPNPLPRKAFGRWAAIAIAGVVVIVALVLLRVIRDDNLSAVVIVVTLAAAVAYFAVILSSKRLEPIERSRVFGFIPLFVVSVGFWSLYQQQFTVLTIYSDERLNRDLFGWEMPVSWVQSINPVFIIILSGAFAALWTKLGRRQPPTPVKFGLAAIIMGAAFLLFLPWANGGANATPMLAIIGILFVFTVAELLLSPIGLSVTTKLAPHVFRTQMVALFFLSVALGTAIAGWLGQFYDPKNEVPYFTILALAAAALGVVLLLFTKPVLALMRGVR